MHCRPSEMLEIDDAYTAFCFDEVIAYIISRLKQGDKIKLPQAEAKNYKRPSDLYKQFQ